MASERLTIFHNLIAKKKLKYLSFDEASIFLTNQRDKIVLRKAVEMLDHDQPGNDEVPPRYTVYDTHPSQQRVYEESQDVCIPELSQPWFTIEVPRELRRVGRNAPGEICVILQLACLENTSKRIAALTSGEKHLDGDAKRGELKPTESHRIDKNIKSTRIAKKLLKTASVIFNTLLLGLKPNNGAIMPKKPRSGLVLESCKSCLEYLSLESCTLAKVHVPCPIGYTHRFQTLKKGIIHRQSDDGSQFDGSLFLHGILSRLFSDHTLTIKPEKLDDLLAETAKCPAAVAIRAHFKALREAFGKVHQAQLEQIRQRNATCIRLAMENRDRTYIELQSRRTVNDIEKSDRKGEVCLKSLDGEVPRYEAAWKRKDECDEECRDLDEKEVPTELCNTAGCHGQNRYEEGREQAVWNAEQILLHTQTRAENDEKWAHVTATRCLEMVSAVEGWEWEALWRYRLQAALNLK